MMLGGVPDAAVQRGQDHGPAQPEQPRRRLDRRAPDEHRAGPTSTRSSCRTTPCYGGRRRRRDPVSGSLYVGPVYQSEILSPTTNTWSLADTQAEERTYHSTALLLPSGQVVSAGDDRPGHQFNTQGELYSPPYLFKGAAAGHRVRPDGRQLRRAVPDRHGLPAERDLGEADPPERGHPRQRHDPALDRAEHDHPGRRPDPDQPGQRQHRHPGLLHAVRAQRAGRPLGGQDHPAQPDGAGRPSPARRPAAAVGLVQREPRHPQAEPDRDAHRHLDRPRPGPSPPGPGTWTTMALRQRHGRDRDGLYPVAGTYTGARAGDRQQRPAVRGHRERLRRRRPRGRPAAPRRAT